MNFKKSGLLRKLVAVVAFLCLLVGFTNCSGGFTSATNAGAGASNASGDQPGTGNGTPNPQVPSPAPSPVPAPGPVTETGDYQPDNGPLAKGSSVINVTTAQEFMTAIANSKAGDEITLADGSYDINTDKIRVSRQGTASNYIFVRSKNPMKATLKLCTSSSEGFYVSGAAYWVFENMVITNGCETTTDHAFHITGSTKNFIIRNNLITDFRSHVKVNGEGSPRLYPNDLWFINNTWKITHDLPAKGVPHNVLNIDGGHGHVVRGNSFVDQLHPNRSTSSIYIKMGTMDFLVEQNLVVCQKHLKLGGYSPRGIFSGDASSAPNPLCENEDCFNYRGIYRNNIVMNCTGDGNVSGIQVHLEKATQYIHNTVVGVKNNFFFDDPQPVDISFYSNVMEKPFSFQGATRPSQYLDNLEQGTTGTSQIYTQPLAGDFSLKDGSLIRQKVSKRSDATFDFCGNRRSDKTDLGAIDYSHPKASQCVQAIKALYHAL